MGHTCFTLTTGSAQQREVFPVSACTHTQRSLSLSPLQLWVGAFLQPTKREYWSAPRAWEFTEWLHLMGDVYIKQRLPWAAKPATAFLPLQCHRDLPLTSFSSLSFHMVHFSEVSIGLFFIIFKKSLGQCWALLKSCIHCHFKWVSSKAEPPFLPWNAVSITGIKGGEGWCSVASRDYICSSPAAGPTWRPGG